MEPDPSQPPPPEPTPPTPPPDPTPPTPPPDPPPPPPPPDDGRAAIVTALRRATADAARVPVEMVTGDTPEEIAASVAAAEATVARALEMRAAPPPPTAPRVPAGPSAPPPDTSKMSPAAKIAYGLTRNGG